MFRGLYTSYTGMKVMQEKVDVISNNIANVDTTAYKRDRVIEKSFKDVLTSKIRDGKVNKKIGKMNLGVYVDKIYTDFSQGPIKQTDDPFDIAIEGKGFFKIASIDEEGNKSVKYTRDGSFTLNSDGELVTKDGFYVLAGDEKMNLNDSDYARINQDGTVYQNGIMAGKLDIVSFEDNNTLKKIGTSMYEAGEISKEIPFEGKLQQGFLEGSGVNSVDEVINLITATRVYESNQKIIQTYDETMSKVVNEVGAVK